MKLKILQIKEATEESATSARVIADSMQEEARADRECLWVLHLNTQLKVIEKELVAMGVLDAAYVQPREVFKKAILNSACSIITVHNHPSGEATPSANDKEIWHVLVKAGKLLGIPVIDNIILGADGKFYSDKEEGLTGDYK